MSDYISLTPTVSVLCELPEPWGVREIRYSKGAQKRTIERFGGGSLLDIINKHADPVIAELTYLWMYDVKGNPPPFTLEEFMEALPGDSTKDLLALLLMAINNGKLPKDQAVAYMDLLAEASATEALKKLGITPPPGLSFGGMLDSISDSPMPSSGGLPTENSMPSATAGESANDGPTSGPESSPPLA